MINYLQYFFKPAHLFSLRPEAMRPRALIILAIIFGSFIIAAIIFKLIKTKDALRAKGFKKLTYLFTSMGVSGYIYLFFGWQGATLLSARFLLLIWLIVTLIWLLFILKYLIIEVPKKRKEIKDKRLFEKYIP